MIPLARVCGRAEGPERRGIERTRLHCARYKQSACCCIDTFHRRIRPRVRRMLLQKYNQAVFYVLNAMVSAS